MSKQFNRELLLLARQYRERSQAELAEMAGFDQGHYSKIERGLLNLEPSPETVQSLAQALDFPVSYFYQNDELSGLPLSIHDASWRKRASTKASEVKRLHAELNLRIMHLRRYLEAVDVDSELPLPSLDVDEVGGPTKVAQLLRRAWMIPPGPIKNLTALCERSGIIVIHCNFAEKVDGVTMRLRDVPPLIFLNGNAPPDRQRHSLAHELGHLIMHSIPCDEMEQEADAFAGELLVPTSELRADLIGARITLERLVQLKKYWKVSVASLLYRASHGGLLSDNQSSYLWRRLSALGWRKREPDETQFEAEMPKVYPQILKLHEEDLGYDIDDISAMIHFSKNDVRAVYGIASRNGGRSHLRVI